MQLTPTPSIVCERLLVVTHVAHYMHQGRVLAYAPYAIELGQWAGLTHQLLVAAPLRYSAPTDDCAVIPASNIVLVRQPETGGHTLPAKLRQIALLPHSVAALALAMRGVDAVHVRCPGNIGLLGALLAPIACRRRIAKYAGQWSEFPHEPWSVRLQRSILRSRWWNAPVLVYDRATSGPANVIPFFASVFNAGQMDRACKVARVRQSSRVSKLLFVGRLTPQKNVAVLLRALAALRSEELSLECAIVGDGPERATLAALAYSLGIDDLVSFDGAQSVDAVLARYEWADALALPSESEGWPKALAEAMAFGLCCIGPDRGLVPWMLGEGRGVVVTPGKVDELANAIRAFVAAGDKLAPMRTAASTWAQQYTVERFGSDLRKVLSAHWAAIESPGLRTLDA